MRAGLAELNEHVQAILFCLVIGPFVTRHDQYSKGTPSGKEAACFLPRISRRRGNPVLFSVEMRPRLLLKGDEGDVHYWMKRIVTVAVQTECRVSSRPDQPEDIERAIEYYRQQAKIVVGNNFVVETLFQNMD